MDTIDFSARVNRFAEESKQLLESTLRGETRLETSPFNLSDFRAAFKLSQSLYVQRTGSDRLHLDCEYRLCKNSTGDYLAVDKSAFKIEFRALKKYVPIVRFEYERHARNKPASHIQFHADSVPLGLLLARAGKHDLAAQQQNIHFPAGDSRYRICLEDVVEFLIDEFGADAKDSWIDQVKQRRKEFHEIQTDTVIRKNMLRAVSILEESGYAVDPPAQ